MSGTVPDAVANQVLDDLVSSGNVWPDPVYIGLSHTDPLDDGSGTTEYTDANYARIPHAAADWEAAGTTTARVKGTTTDVTQAAFAAGAVAPVAYVIFDAVTSGTFLGSGTITGSAAISAGDQPSLPAHTVQVAIP